MIMTSIAIREILQFRYIEVKSVGINQRLINSYNILLNGNKSDRSKSWWVSLLVADLCNVNMKYTPKVTFDELKSYINSIKK